MYLLSQQGLFLGRVSARLLFKPKVQIFLRIEPIAAGSEKLARGSTFIRHEDYVYAVTKFS
jgi:hypothetical protein